MQVRNTVSSESKQSIREQVARLFEIFLPMEGIMMTARAVGVFLLVAGTALGGGLASAQINRDAIPGSLSYKMKIAIEGAQIALAPTDAYRTQLHTEFADRRMDELAHLADGSAKQQAQIPATLAAFNGEVAALGNGLEALKASDPQGVIETAKLLERKMAVYQDTLHKVQVLAAADVQPGLRDSLGTVDGVTLRAMSVIVEHHIAGDIEAPKNVVVTKFEDRIKDAESKLQNAPAAKNTAAKAAIAAAKELIKEEKYEAALSKIVEVAKLTEEGDPDAGVTPAPVAKPDAAAPTKTDEKPVTNTVPSTSH
jgi:hypothetical protein